MFPYIFQITDQDLDDLDLLACLVDSDSELLDDNNVDEEIPSSNTSPQSTTKTPIAQSQSKQDSSQSGTTSNLTMEEMAGQ